MSRQEEYLKFLDTGFWLMLLDRCLERDGHKCTRCGSKERLQAHHVQYPADWYDTVLEHLVTLCRECHEKEHGIEPEPEFQPPAREPKRPFLKPESKSLKKLKARVREALLNHWAEIDYTPEEDELEAELAKVKVPRRKGERRRWRPR